MARASLQWQIKNKEPHEQFLSKGLHFQFIYSCLKWVLLLQSSAHVTRICKLIKVCAQLTHQLIFSFFKQNFLPFRQEVRCNRQLATSCSDQTSKLEFRRPTFISTSLLLTVVSLEMDCNIRYWSLPFSKVGAVHLSSLKSALTYTDEKCYKRVIY